MGPKAGDRVGAILSIDNLGVNFLGYGVYEGDFFYPGIEAPNLDEDEKFKVLDEAQKEVVRARVMRFLGNPRIKLDSGEVVWGMECWWGPEEEVKAQIADRPVFLHKILRDEKGAYTGSATVQ